ncbi:MAG TPA: NAD-glutamate dehydrogenase, partial [Xanthobacteraceae bacterium]
MNETTTMPVPGVDGEDDKARRLIAAAGAALTAGAPPHFAELLFGRVAPEDLIHYDAADLARLAQSAWAFLAERQPGAVKLRMEQPDGGAHLDDISVIEIINDDMPFLLDSTMDELAEQGVEVRLVAHPVLMVGRGPDGRLAGLSAAGKRESLIHIHVERIADEEHKAVILNALRETLTEVNHAVADWRAMLGRVNEIIADLKAQPPPLPAAEVAEAIEFLQWMLLDNFTFLGMRGDAYDEAGGVLTQEGGTELGILRHRLSEVMTAGGERLEVPAAARAFLREPQALVTIKTNQLSRVHRRVTMDLVGVKRYDAAGRLVGIFRIVGLFTSTAYTRSIRGIPYLRRKTASVVARAGLDPDSHSGKALAVVLEQYPRDELFQIDEETLLRFGLMILQLDERPRVRVLARRDRFDRFVSVLVYVPRDRFDSTIRREIGELLADAYAGRVSSFTLFFPEGPLVRLHFIVGRGAARDSARDSAPDSA